MTFCAGWKYKGAVYLIADTAVTKPDKPRSDYSSFGQLHSSTKDGYVEESLLKLIPISKGMAIGFAGDVQVATEIIGLLKDNVQYADSVRDLLRIADNMGPFDPKRSVTLLIASSTAQGSVELIKWDSLKGIDQSEADFYQIGSLTSYHSAFTSEFLNFLISGNLAIDRILPTIISVVQSYGVYDDLIQMNVGGLIFGLYTSHGNVYWQEDTNYIIYGPNIDKISYISAIARDNVIIISSSITNENRIFAHSISVNRTTIFSQDWRRRVQEQIDSDRFRYWVFISIQDRVITLLIRNDLQSESKYVRLSKLSNGKFDLAMSPELIQLLRQAVEDKNDGSIPFRLNVRND